MTDLNSPTTRTPEEQLLDDLSQPDEGVLDALASLEGDLLVLGAGGKMGLGVALMAQRALRELGKPNRVVAVSRFSAASSRRAFEQAGLETIACDLSDPRRVAELPDAAEILYLVGHKFGTSSNSGTTWLLNCFVPGVVCQRWPGSRIVALSSGNIYPLTPAASGGPTEQHPVGPVGEYAQTVLGRERMFEHFARADGTQVAIVRLNYANEPRYGVLVDLAQRILKHQPIDVSQGYVNIVWQGDCNRMTLKAFHLASTPPTVMNLAGPETLSVRELATKLGAALGEPVTIVGQESPDALLSNGAYGWKMFGPPSLSPDAIIERIAAWLRAGQATLGRPTHFEVRDGKF
jgi:nucleoside-diphosphate-sugar epimerase